MDTGELQVTTSASRFFLSSVQCWGRSCRLGWRCSWCRYHAPNHGRAAQLRSAGLWDVRSREDIAALPAGVGLPMAFVVVGLGGAGVIALVRRVRGSPTRDAMQQTTRARRAQISRVVAVLLVGLIVSVANVNAFPGEAERSFAAWVLVALLSLLPFAGGLFLLLRYIRQRIGATEFESNGQHSEGCAARPTAGDNGSESRIRHRSDCNRGRVNHRVSIRHGSCRLLTHPRVDFGVKADVLGQHLVQLVDGTLLHIVPSQVSWTLSASDRLGSARCTPSASGTRSPRAA